MNGKVAGATAILPRQVMLNTSIIALTAMVGVISLALWLTSTANQQARTSNLHLVETALRTEIERLDFFVADHAWWDILHTAVLARDEPVLYDNFGVTIAEDGAAHTAAIFEASFAPVFAVKQGKFQNDLGAFQPDVAADLLTTLPPFDPEAYATSVGYTAGEDGVFLHVLGRVLPYEFDGVDIPSLPMMLISQQFDDQFLTSLESRLAVSDMQVSAAAPAEDARIGDVALRATNGEVVAHLSWPLPRPGDQLLKSSLPVIAAIGLILGLGVVLVSQNSGRQARIYLQEQKMARRDSLTGLLNRRGLNDLLQSEDMKIALGRQEMAVLYLDLNGFKALNDTKGHKAGDNALRITAERLRDSVRESDYIARTGGDEFAIFLPGKKPFDCAKKVAERVQTACAPEITIDDEQWAVRPSIGVAVAGSDEEWDRIMSRADEAMYLAKDARAQWPVFSTQNGAKHGQAA